MIVLPVIHRELAALSRQTATFTSRTAGAGALLAVCAYVGIRAQFGVGFGTILFSELHAVLLGSIWIFVPMLIADCISRERRDGTLPLLALTALRAHDIVIAKGLTQSLRAFTLLLAALPVLTIPFLLGGVSWRQAVASAASTLASLFLVTGTTLVASSFCKSWTRSISLAMVFSAISFWLVTKTFGFQALSAGVGTMLVMRNGVAVPGPFAPPLAAGSLTFVICSAALLPLMVAIAARNVNRAAREEPPSTRVLEFHRRFFTPVFFTGTLKRWLKWEMYRNPIGWLEQRSWVNRLVIWSWFAILISVYSWFFGNFTFLFRSFTPFHTILAWLMAGSIAATASGSFRRERETGVLELLLISPLNEWRIVFGRLRGIWTQFAPSIILMCSVWVFWSTFLLHEGEYNFWTIAYFVSLFLTLPIVGLHYSLKTSNFMGALLRTLAVGILIPSILAWGLSILASPRIYRGNPDSIPFYLTALLFQGGLAVLLIHLLHRNLKERRFVVASAT